MIRPIIIKQSLRSYKPSWISPVRGISISAGLLFAAQAPHPPHGRLTRSAPTMPPTTQTHHRPAQPHRESSLRLIPDKSWDSHMHIFNETGPNPESLPSSDEGTNTSAPVHPPTSDPPAPDPPPKSQSYNPPRSTITDIHSLLADYTPRMIIVQPSIFGQDNRVTLGGVRDLNEMKTRAGTSAAVVEVPLGVGPEVLGDLDQRGARGVRINLVSRALTPDIPELRGKLALYADMIRPLGWVLQIYIRMEWMDGLVDGGFLQGLGVPVVIDHFAQPTLSATASHLPPSLPGLDSLLSTLSPNSSSPRNIYIKLSGHYRLLPPDPDQPYTQLKQLFHKFLDHGASDRLVWGSDWPHTRFEGIDTVGWAEMVVGWCREYVERGRGGEDEDEVKRLVSRVFRDNADELWMGRR